MAHRAIVVKVGGSTLGSHDTSLQDLADLRRRGEDVVVVHGGGAAISDWLTRMQTPTRFVNGLRVTDEATLAVVTAVLGGLINKQLVAELCALGAPAVGLSGADGGMLRAGYEDEALGYVGRVEVVDPSPLQALIERGFVPVVAPLALLQGPEGVRAQLLNVNADTVAGEIAAALGAARLIFLTDVEGVRGVDGATLRELSAPEADRLLTQGVVAGGMIPKVRAALRAREGRTDTLIVDGRGAHGLLAALRDDPPGTRVQ